MKGDVHVFIIALNKGVLGDYTGKKFNIRVYATCRRMNSSKCQHKLFVCVQYGCEDSSTASYIMRRPSHLHKML